MHQIATSHLYPGPLGRDVDQLPVILTRSNTLEQAVDPNHAQAGPGVGLTGKLFSSGCLIPVSLAVLMNRCRVSEAVRNLLTQLSHFLIW